MAKAKLLDVGTQERWWCPDCGEVKTKAQYEWQGNRYHSHRCRKPLVRATITVAPLDGMGRDE